MTGADGNTVDPELAARWMAAFGGLADRAAHGIKNQLNAVAVNVEVVRARSARGGDAVAVASFADTAANEFERSAGVVEALLALVRPEREPVDVGTLLARFVTLNRAATEAPTITVRRLDDGAPVTTAPGTAVRAALACVLQSALAGGGEVTCDLACARGILLRVAGATDQAPSPGAPVAELLQRHGIVVRTSGSSVELHFPAQGAEQRTLT